jgi:CRISPR system Cascade subunit CasE
MDNAGRRNLWRLDNLNNSLYLLLQSEVKPDFTHIAEQFGWLGQTWETKEYDGFLSLLQNGQVWKFRLRANPVRSKNEEGKSRGKVLGHTTIGKKMEWFAKRTVKYGFEMEQTSDGDPVFNVTQIETKKFQRKGEMVTFDTAVFEGVLRIIDAELLADTIRKGIGREKAYGCGLLTLAGQSCG